MTAEQFIAAADTFIAALPAFVTQANALASFAVEVDVANSASAATSRYAAETAANTSVQKATAAALSAETARAIVGIPPAYASLIMQPNRIDIDMTIPDGQNAVIFGNFEVSPDVTVTGLGNANFVGLG